MPLLRTFGNWRLMLAVAFVLLPLSMFVAPSRSHASVHGTEGSSTISARLQSHAKTPTEPSVPLHVGVHWSERTAGTGKATISWRAPASDGGSPITGYVVTTGSSTCSPADPSLSSLSCSISKLAAGVKYTFVVEATNDVGSSQASAISSLNAEGQVITFDQLPDAVFGEGPLTLTASASSGLPVTYTATGACSVAGDLLTIAGIGSCAIIAYQDGSTAFQAATPIATFFQISQGTAVLSATGGKFVANGKAHPVDVTAVPVVSGISVTYCVSTGVKTETCSATPPVSPGVYRATIKLTNPNYVALPVKATVTINTPPAVLPAALLGGPALGTGATVFSKYGVEVHTTGHGFTGGSTVDVGGVSEESLGSFVVPAGNDVTSWLNLLRGSSPATVVLDANAMSAANPEQLSFKGSLAFPDGNFPGAGVFEMIEVQSTGFVPHTTVSVILHSAPIVLAQAVANANGVVTIYVPVPKAFVGQSHTLMLSGTYLVTKTTAASDGSVPVAVLVNKGLLHRLVGGAPFLVVFSDPSNSALQSFDTIALPTESALDAYIKFHTPLNIPPYKPVNHPDKTMTDVTGAAAALSAAAAGIAAARAAGGVSGAAAASHTASITSRGADTLHRASTENIEAIHHTHDAGREHVGDHSITWKTPGYQKIDSFSLAAPVALARFSPLAAVSVSDAGYWRAVFGSMSLMLPVAGLVLGAMSAHETNGYPLPPHFALFATITVLGFLDATAGLAAALVSLAAAIITGHAFDLNMVISGLLLAVIWFGLPVMVKKVRPFIRPHPRTFQDWWVRLADFVVGAAFAGYLSAKLVDSFSLVTNLRIDIIEEGGKIGWIVFVAALARYFLTTGTVFLYPKRLASVTPATLPKQEDRYLAVSIAIRLFFGTLIFIALLGTKIVVMPLVALLAIGMWTRSRERRTFKSDWIYRLVPRNVGKIYVFELVGTVATIWLLEHVEDPFWQITDLLFVILVLGLLLDGLGTIRGKPFPVNWLTRLGGVGLVVLTYLQLTGHLIE